MQCLEDSNMKQSEALLMQDPRDKTNAHNQ
jgi:hypothetical protein